MSGSALTTKGLITESGLSLSTKGLIFAGGLAPPIQSVAAPAPETLPFPAGVPGPVVIVIPTAPNMLLVIAQNIAANLRASQAANLVLPSLYKRAYLMAYETDEIAVTMP